MAKPTTSRCIIEIQIERPERSYKPGERIRGSIEILPGADMKCRKVTLAARWVAHGKGPEDAADYETVVFPGGAWRNNEKVSHAFDFAAPQVPCSYEGELFDIRWYLTANADLPATKDASATVKFQVLPGPVSDPSLSFNLANSYNPFAAMGSPVAPPASTRYPTPAIYTALSWMTGIITLGVLVLIGLYFVGLNEMGQWDDVGGALVWSIAILGAVHTIGAIFRKKWRARRREALNRLAMRPAEHGAPPRRAPGKYWEKAPPDDSRRGWPRSITSLSLAAVGLLLLALGLIYAFSHDWGPESGAAVASAMAGFLIAFCAKGGIRPSWRFIKTALALGPIEVILSPERVRCGDELHVHVDFRTSLPSEIKQATATLEAYEVVEDYFRNLQGMDMDTIQAKFKALNRQRKKYRDARVGCVYSQDFTLATGRTLLPQESANLSGKFAVSPSAPPTFLAVGNKILWFMAVRVKLASGVQWSADIPIFVQP